MSDEIREAQAELRRIIHQLGDMPGLLGLYDQATAAYGKLDVALASASMPVEMGEEIARLKREVDALIYNGAIVKADLFDANVALDIAKAERHSELDIRAAIDRVEEEDGFTLSPSSVKRMMPGIYTEIIWLKAELAKSKAYANFRAEEITRLFIERDAAIAEAGMLRNFAQDVVNWSEAYPLKTFSEPSPEEVLKVCTAAGVTMDCIAAMILREYMAPWGAKARAILRGKGE